MVNYLVVLVAAVIAYGLGMFWYSPLLLGKSWRKNVGISRKRMEEHRQGMWKKYIVGFIGTIVMSFVLAVAIDMALVTTAVGGLGIGFLMWLGFAVPVLLGKVLWEMKPVKLYLIDTCYYLVSIMLMGLIIAAWL